MKKFLVGFLILFLCLDGLSYASRRKRKGLITPPSKPIEEQSKIGVSVQDFEFNTKNLKKGCKEGVSFSLSKVEGKQNEALKIKYDLGKPPAWCEVCAPLSVIPETGGIYTFYIRGDSGNNVLEFKLVDEDDTTFLSKVPLNDISPEKWTEKVVEYDSLHYGWGGKNKKLDGKVKLGLAISTGHGGKGYVEIDELYYKHVSILAELQLSQIGYRPEDKKAVVLRVKGKVDKKKCPKSVKFSVVDDSSGKIGFTRIMNLVDFSDWEGIYYKGDFSSLRKSGKYRIEASFKYGRDRMELVSYPFIIDKNAFSKSLAWSQWHFLKHLRCGERCHLKDPVPGGYHDTLDDIGKRMWSHNHLVNGIANYARLSPVQQSVIEIDGTPDSIGALKWGTRYCIDITGGDGSVPWSGVSHRMKWEDYCSKILPIIDLAEDHYPRYRNNDKSNAATAFNVVALLNAAKALEKYDKELADEAIRTAKKNWGYINRKGFGTSFDMGCYIYASLELYKFTGDKKYVGKVSKNAKKMLKLQYNDYNNVEDNICGDFYFSNREKDFHFQYKMINFNIGIYMALVELCNYLGVDDLMWWDVYYAAKVFTENYLLPMASKTPYGQMAHGLEKENDGKWHVYYFAGDCDSARKAAAQTHGLNCDHFGYGLIAMKWGQHTNDLRFEEYADNQFQWVFGQNPLGLCMISGVGGKQPVVMCAFNGKGPVAGGIPNGIMDATGKYPEWWGEAASSGEYWMPHNSYFLALMPILELDAEVSGTVVDGLEPVGDADITIYCGKKKAMELKTKEDGSFGPVTLAPQKEYIFKIIAKDAKIAKKIELLSGDREKLDIDIENVIDVDLEFPDEVCADEEVEAVATVYNKGIAGQVVNLKILIKGAKLEGSGELQVELEPGDKKVLNFKVIPSGKIPLLIRVQDKLDKEVFAEVFRLPAKKEEPQLKIPKRYRRKLRGKKFKK